MGNSSEDDELRELRVKLEPDFFEKLELIKEYYGIKNNTEIIRYIVTREYREIFDHPYTKNLLKERKKNK